MVILRTNFCVFCPKLVSPCTPLCLGSSIAIIRATDSENDPIVFSLDSVGDKLLNIDNTGNLTLQQALDREVSNSYSAGDLGHTIIKRSKLAVCVPTEIVCKLSMLTRNQVYLF